MLSGNLHSNPATFNGTSALTCSAQVGSGTHARALRKAATLKGCGPDGGIGFPLESSLGFTGTTFARAISRSESTGAGLET